MQVLTITLNPALDLTAGVRELVPGGVNRVQWHQEDPAGKGVNVAAFLAEGGARVAVSGFLGRENDAPFRALFAAKGIEDLFLRVDGRTRSNVKLVDDARGDDGITDLNFPGFVVTGAHLAELEATLERAASGIDWCVISGSLPLGVEPAVVADLIGRLRRKGAKVALDTSGAALVAGIAALPDLVKPNRAELTELFGRPLGGVKEGVAAARELQARGVRTVIVSMGADGAVFCADGAAVVAVPPPAQVRSTVGAGDAMVAGYLLGTLRGLDLAGRARLATAYGAGAVSTVGPRLPPRAQVEAAVSAVRITAHDQ